MCLYHYVHVPNSVFCIFCYDYIRLVILMIETCLFNYCILLWFKNVLLMKKAFLPKILAVFIYGFIQNYIYLYPIYNSNQQVNEDSLFETSRHLQQKICQLKKLKENNCFSIAIKYYFYILLNIIIANSSQ